MPEASPPVRQAGGVVTLAVLAVLSIFVVGSTQYLEIATSSLERDVRAYEKAWDNLLAKVSFTLNIDDVTTDNLEFASNLQDEIAANYEDILAMKQALDRKIARPTNQFLLSWFNNHEVAPAVSQDAHQLVLDLTSPPPDILLMTLPGFQFTIPAVALSKKPTQQLREAQEALADISRMLSTFSREMIFTTSVLIMILSYFLWRRQIAPRIAELDHALVEIYQKESLLSSTMASVSEAIIVCDAEGRVSNFNPSASTLTGYAEEEAEGVRLSEVLDLRHPDGNQRLDVSSLQSLLDEKVTHREMRTCALFSRDGTKYQVQETAAVIHSPSGADVGTVIVMRDVTEETRRRNAQESVFRLQSLGQLAAGVSHDFNNILASIRITAELAALQVDTPTVHELMESITQSVDRGTAMTGRLRNFAQPDAELDPADVDVRKVCESALGLLENTIARNITVNLDMPQAASMVRCDARALENIFINLGINSANAMPDGGQIQVTIKARQRIKPNDPKEQARESVVIEWHDSGHGIPSHIIDRVFEPFFTTKRTSGGTGLGLSIVASTIQSFGGEISCESEVGKYTKFTIALPQTDGSSRSTRRERTGLPKQLSASILIVDDEETLAQTLGTGLRTLGAQVQVVHSGTDAIALYETQGHEFDFIILDQNMPGISGSDTARAIFDIDPNQPIVVTSGNLPDDLDNAFEGLPVRAILYKPVRFETLVRTISDELEAVPQNLHSGSAPQNSLRA